HTFLKAGLKKGDTVLVMSPRLIDTYEVYIAALKLGLIVSPAADMLRTSDLAYRIKNGDVKAVVVYYPFLDIFEKLDQIDDLEKFVIGKEVEGWKNLTELKENESEELEKESSHSVDTVFFSYTSGCILYSKRADHKI